MRRSVRIPAGDVVLPGDLHVPHGARGVVAFAHGSGTTRRDPLNRFIARRLGEAGLATLLLELLEAHQARDRHHVFDVELQARRLSAATTWLATASDTQALPIGYFGTGVGAGVALLAAARSPEHVLAVVSRGGRPDTALGWLPRVAAPLFICAERGDGAEGAGAGARRGAAVSGPHRPAGLNAWRLSRRG